MLDKINAELEHCIALKNDLENEDYEKVVADEVAKFKAELIEKLEGEKEAKLKELDFKINILQEWQEEELLKPAEPQVEPVEEKKVEEVVKEEVEEVKEPAEDVVIVSR